MRGAALEKVVCQSTRALLAGPKEERASFRIAMVRKELLALLKDSVPLSENKCKTPKSQLLYSRVPLLKTGHRLSQI